MIIKDYYKILGFESNKVHIEEIKNAYRDLAKKYHPDVNSNNPKAEERFKDIGEAYNILSNDKQRRKYDRLWNYYIGRRKKQSAKYQNAKIKDFFGLFFGEKKSKTEKETVQKNNILRGEDINTEITITIAESFFGATKSLEFKTIGNGRKKIDIKIPAGIRNNEKVRIIGQGKQGKNGGKNGDLFIKVKIKDNPNLKLQGIDLYTDLLITPWESALSTKVNVISIDEEIEVEIPKGIQSGDKITIKGKGYKDGKGGRGNLIAVVKIMMPKSTTEEELKLFKKLNEISKFNPRRIKSI